MLTLSLISGCECVLRKCRICSAVIPLDIADVTLSLVNVATDMFGNLWKKYYAVCSTRPDKIKSYILGCMHSINQNGITIDLKRNYSGHNFNNYIVENQLSSTSSPG